MDVCFGSCVRAGNFCVVDSVMCIISINDLPYDTVINFSFEIVFLIWFAVYLIAGLLTTFFLRQPVAKND